LTKPTKVNFLYNLLLQGSNVIFPLITFPYVSHILGPDGYGAVSFAQNFAQYFVTLSALGIPVYGIREISKVYQNSEARSKLFSEIFWIHTITTMVGMTAYLLIIIFVERTRLDLPLYIWSGGLIILSLFPLEWLFSGLSDFKFISLRGIVVKGINLGLLFIVVQQKDDVLSYVQLSVFTLLLNSVINVYKARSYVTLWFKDLDIKRHLKPLLYIYGSTLAVSIYIQLDTVILGFLRDDKEVGLYSVGVRIAKLPLTVVASLGAVLIPKLSNLIDTNNWAEIKILADKSFNFICTFCIPISIALFIVAPEIVTFLCGEEFIDASWSLRLMAPLVIVIGFGNLFAIQLLTPMRKDKEVLIAIAFGTFINVLLNIALVPTYGHKGASLATLSTEIIVTLINYRFVLKHTVLKFNFNKILLLSTILSLSFFPISSLVDIFKFKPLSSLIITVVFCSTFYSFFQMFIFRNEFYTAAKSYLQKSLATK
jgi:O-antigen/teichoic acid export membrane protein